MLGSRLRFPTRKKRVTILSDGNKQNLTAIPKQFPQCAINYALRKKKQCIEERLEIFSVQHNFIESKKGETSGMRE